MALMSTMARNKQEGFSGADMLHRTTRVVQYGLTVRYHASTNGVWRWGRGAERESEREKKREKEGGSYGEREGGRDRETERMADSLWPSEWASDDDRCARRRLVNK